MYKRPFLAALAAAILMLFGIASCFAKDGNEISLADRARIYIDEYNYCLKKNTCNRYEALVGRAWCYYHAGQYENAIADFSEALNLAATSTYKADRSALYFARASALSALGRHAEAAADHRSAMEALHDETVTKERANTLLFAAAVLLACGLSFVGLSVLVFGPSGLIARFERRSYMPHSIGSSRTSFSKLFRNRFRQMACRLEQRCKSSVVPPLEKPCPSPQGIACPIRMFCW